VRLLHPRVNFLQLDFWRVVGRYDLRDRLLHRFALPHNPSPGRSVSCHISSRTSPALLDVAFVICEVHSELQFILRGMKSSIWNAGIFRASIRIRPPISCFGGAAPAGNPTGQLHSSPKSLLGFSENLAYFVNTSSLSIQ